MTIPNKIKAIIGYEEKSQIKRKIEIINQIILKNARYKYIFYIQLC